MKNNLAPVLVIAFNRPDLLEKLLLKLKNQNRCIYISIDGPRSTEEEHLVEHCRSIALDFKQNGNTGSVKTQFHDKNLGCKMGVITAVNFAFDEEEKLIVLEDDINFDNSFLEFCDEGLRIFEKFSSIWHFSGWSPLRKALLPPSIYMSKYPHIWGWATWKSRWLQYDSELSTWNNCLPSSLPTFKNCTLPRDFDKFWSKQFELAKSSEYDVWDAQWAYSIWKNGGYSISPGLTLTQNIGFDSRATHTVTPLEELNRKTRESILQDINTNSVISADSFNNCDLSFKWDRYHEEIVFFLPYDPYSIRYVCVKLLKWFGLLKITKQIYKKFRFTH